MITDRPLRLRRRAITLLACALCLAAAWGLAQWPAFVDHVYAQHAGAFIARALSAVTGVVPFSLAEITLAGVVVHLLVTAGMAMTQVIRKRRRFANAIAVGSLRVAVTTGLVLVVFYAFWGLNYARAPLPARLGWPTVAAPVDRAEHDRQTAELAGLTRQLVDATNGAYREIAGGDDLGRPSDRPSGSRSLDAVLESSYPRVQQRLALDSGFGAARGRAKPVVVSGLMNYLGITGFYFPWTGEANYNHLVPAATLPHTIAHEKAHQRGIAREDEANFFGFLACVASDDAYTRYSGYLFAQRQLLGELASRDLATARELVGARLPGVQRDVDFIRAYWLQYEGPATRASKTVNNTYLRAQGDNRGVAAYAASRNLIVMFARHNGGSAIVR